MLNVCFILSSFCHFVVRSSFNNSQRFPVAIGLLHKTTFRTTMVEEKTVVKIICCPLWINIRILRKCTALINGNKITKKMHNTNAFILRVYNASLFWQWKNNTRRAEVYILS